MDDFSMNDFELGSNVISYTLHTLGVGIAIAIAWSCSTLLMGLVMAIVMGIVMALLMELVHLVLLMKLPAATTCSIGHAVGGAAARITGLFSRKAKAPVAEAVTA